MRDLSSLILFLALSVSLYSQSPHERDLQYSCADCHNPKGWKLEKGTYSFDHNKTRYQLVGQHQEVDCKMCHTSLQFANTETNCNSCHTDMHYQTVGTDCARCHTPNSWIVENITSIHQMSRFPLFGPHVTADCYDCHPSESLLRFEPLGVECYDCHEADYMATTNPIHKDKPDIFTTNCNDCHSVNAFTWTGAGFNHSFFPLTGGHALNDCTKCHPPGSDYSSISADCYSCHQTDYANTNAPDHIGAGIPTNCIECHTTNPGWKPADFRAHDAQYFPVYSGKHSGTWNSCTECHPNPNNYVEFTCISCHEQASTDEHHNEVGGYIYNSAACFECHPTGQAEGGFNHNNSNFPLTGAHTTTECIHCHANGYAGTTTICYDCHKDQYEQSLNPSHLALSISTDCEACHTTLSGWQPALFAVHNQYYALAGAHADIATDCFTCHAGDYNNTPNTCYGCHTNDYNQTTNPPHVSGQYSTECENCHSQSTWVPATFDHNLFFPLTGAHTTTECLQCHANGYGGTPTNCVDCHINDYSESTNPSHIALAISEDCQGCHTTNPGWQPAAFPSHNSYYELLGAHANIASNCFICHAGNYSNTPNTCYGCHAEDYNQTTNPPHASAQFSTECASCHTQNTWVPSTFDHNAFFPLTGAHATTACLECHANGYGGTPANCVDCHINNYNQSTNPNHIALGISQDCPVCHTTSPGWQPAAFPDHNSYYELLGAHTAIASNCFICHAGNYNNTPNTCYGCHADNYNQTTNPPHASAGFSTECLSCHTQNAWVPSTFDHNTYFPLTGAHATAACLACHENGYGGTPTNCVDCHINDYNQSTNPNHVALGISQDCPVCHTTNPGWQPAAFPNHNAYWVISGAHVAIANNCFLCHAGNYNNTPNTCYGCHADDYNQTNNPPHASAQYPTDCLLCHTDVAWIPSTFDHDAQYFPIYSGSHNGEWDACSDCHTNPGNYAIFSCLGCHSQADMDEEHQGVPGYSYNSNACYQCHPTGSGGGKIFRPH